MRRCVPSLAVLLLACSAPGREGDRPGDLGATAEQDAERGSSATSPGDSDSVPRGDAMASQRSSESRPAASDPATEGGALPTMSPPGGAPPDSALASAPTLLGDVRFSVPSGAFEAPLSVTMSTDVPGAEVRYTTDRSLPGPTATLAGSDPVVLGETTELRARAFVDGRAAGQPSTALYVRRAFDATSELPLIVLEGYGQGKPTREDRFEAAMMVFEPEAGVARLSAAPTLPARASYHLRGHLSRRFEKAPYRIELWDNDDRDADLPLLGMPAEADWALIGPYVDRTLIRNALVYAWGREMGLSSMRLSFAEVYVHQDPGPLEPEDYQGVYAVTEIIKNQKNRLDLRQLTEQDTAPSALSGGYIFKFEEGAVDEGETTIDCTGSEPWSGGFGGRGGTCFWDLVVDDPEPIAPEQLAWLSDYVQGFHDALHEQPIGGYARYVDVSSFVDHFIINEITRDIDAYTRSSYFHKDRDDVIRAGPLWDYNVALNSNDDSPEGWQWQQGRPGNNDWFRVLARDAEFMRRVAARWRELRLGLLSDDGVAATIAELAAPLESAAVRDVERWPVDGYQFTEPGLERFAPRGPLTWRGQIDALQSWIAERMVWLDAQL